MFIRGNFNAASIELSDKEGLAERDGPEYYRVTLREGSFEATKKVYAFDPKDDGLPKYFAALASLWKGWEGQRKWSSLEGEFELSCEHDGLGHIKTTASLLSNHGYGWYGEIRFEILAGELDRIANDLKEFFYD